MQVKPVIGLLAAGLLAGCGALAEGLFQPLPPQAAVCAPTATNPAGPFYLPDAPFRDDLRPAEAPGTTLVVAGQVMDTNCAPLAGAVVDVWQADAGGAYDFSADYRYRGRIQADDDGRYQFTTVMPGNYGSRPSHIHFRISHPAAATLTTQLYFEGDPRNATDGLVVSSLIIPLATGPDGSRRGVFDITLGR
mgnify:CR=1 FL=1